MYIQANIHRYSRVAAGGDGKRTLPVVAGEIGDTWIHGVGSDPVKVRNYRAVMRMRSQCIWDGSCMPQVRHMSSPQPSLSDFASCRMRAFAACEAISCVQADAMRRTSNRCQSLCNPSMLPTTLTYFAGLTICNIFFCFVMHDPSTRAHDDWQRHVTARMQLYSNADCSAFLYRMKRFRISLGCCSRWQSTHGEWTRSKPLQAGTCGETLTSGKPLRITPRFLSRRSRGRGKRRTSSGE
jgi:hypothetical protein